MVEFELKQQNTSLLKRDTTQTSLTIETGVWEQFRKKVANERGLDRGIVSATIQQLIELYISDKVRLV